MITPLTAALRLEQPAAQSIAIAALGRMKATAPSRPSVNYYPLQMLNKIEIITAFEEIASPDAAPYLIDQLKQGAPALQAASAQALGQTGGKGAVEALIKTLASDNRATTQAALTALINIGKEAVQPLIQALRSESQQIRNQTLTALRKMKAVPPAAPTYLVSPRRCRAATQGRDRTHSYSTHSRRKMDRNVA